MDKCKIIELITAHLNGNSTPTQEAELSAWIDESAENKIFFESITDENLLSENLARYAIFSRDKPNWEELKIRSTKLSTGSRPIKRLSRYAAAIAAAAILIGGFVYYNMDDSRVVSSPNVIAEKVAVPTLIVDGKEFNLSNETEKIIVNNIQITNSSSRLSYDSKSDLSLQNTIIIPKQCRYKVSLSDGTVVTLNANSSLTYPSNFSGKDRLVKLDGEAYFEVTHKGKPFIVECGDVRTIVYGTRFNVNSHMSNQVRTTLLSGSVAVKCNSNDEIKLKPDQMATIDQNSGYARIDHVNAASVVEWLNDVFMYENASVEPILSDISNWYGIEFSYDKNLFQGVTASVTCDRSLSQEKMIPFLEQLLNVKFIKKSEVKYVIK